MTISVKSRQRGIGLIEPMVAIVILCFGLLGLVQFQVKMISQGTDAQARIAAAALSDDLLTQVRIDLRNVDCYTFPQTGQCLSPFAKAQTAAWAERAQALLPGFVSAGSTLPDPTRFKVTLRWTSKAFKETRVNEVTTDARP